MFSHNQVATNQTPPLSGLDVIASGVALEEALLRQGSLEVGEWPPDVADTFCASRLGGEDAGTLGTLLPGLDLAAIVVRPTPVIER